VSEKCDEDIRNVRSPVAGLRFHDLRHQAITELSEGGASDETIMSIAGHIDRRMMSHYSHIRRQARRAALEQLGKQNFSEGHNQGTVAPESVQRGAEPFSHLKRMAGTTGLEPATSAVTGQRSNQLNYVPAGACASLVGDLRFEPRTFRV
jgi:hypothetical protein